MSDELELHGKTYVSSKKAAESTGYARDYIGQLSRGGLIDAERVGGLWYVSMESLQNYEKNAEIAKSLVPVSSGSKEAESQLSFEGKDYISASRASKITGYNQDYVGQLARGGKIPSKQIGNRWYVDKDALVRHKSEKDALLAAVQAESVGLKQSPVIQKEMPVSTPEHILALPRVNYMQESAALMPLIPEKPTSTHFPVSNFSEIRPRTEVRTEIAPPAPVHTPVAIEKPSFVLKREPRSHKKRFMAASAGMLTIILVLSVGLVTTKNTASFARLTSSDSVASMTAGAASIGSSVLDVVEDIVSPELVYTRGK
ncbi:MAG: helix-turn-helix domain-containing protein [Candidatus Pacebacteria bacterium]|nr:helix-turn-helix domain-containing protein [Candidatus Paceibacterota bacterium]